MHVTEVHVETLGALEADAKAYAVVRIGEAQVVHEGVTLAVAGLLPAHTGGQAVDDVPFGTGVELHGVLVQQILLVAVALCLLVEIVVPAGLQAHFLDGAVLCTHVDDGGMVLTHVLAVGKLAQSGVLLSHLLGVVVHLGLVAQPQYGGSLGTHGQVPVLVDLPVDTDDGSCAKGGLVTVEVQRST